jgi:alkaline phosphatase D
MTTTRRQFLRATGAGVAATVFAPQSLVLPAQGQGATGLLRSGRFREGVVSADPTPSSIALWTRVDDAEGSGRVLLEVARDDGFRSVVTRERIATSGAVNHAVKAQVGGLKPHTEYFYRFATGADDSPVGRFRTAAPADSNEPVRFAFWSCQDYAHGYYNAHELMAREDLDFMVCLGDYIYAETYHTMEDGTAVRRDMIGRDARDETHARDAVTLADYRRKWSLYRSDEALRRVHQKFPMIYIPDDHEVQNNWVGGEQGGGLGPKQMYSAARGRAARKAFFEANPRFPGGTRLYRSLKFGRTAELFVMDQRSYRENQPCGDAITPPCAELPQPRAFLGRPQMDWLKRSLASSQAAWKLLANEVMVMPTIALGNSYLNYDSWQGYPGEREELLAHIRDRQIKDVVFVTGDIHTFIAGDVQVGVDGKGESVALELVGGSVTSQGLGEITLDVGNGVKLQGNDRRPRTDPALIEALRGINTWVDTADFDHHGYGVIEARADGLSSRFVRLQTIKKRSLKTMPSKGFTYSIARGQTSIKGVNGPPAA